MDRRSALLLRDWEPPKNLRMQRGAVAGECKKSRYWCQSMLRGFGGWSPWVSYTFPEKGVIVVAAVEVPAASKP